jgi:hypothetical protein
VSVDVVVVVFLAFLCFFTFLAGLAGAIVVSEAGVAVVSDDILLEAASVVEAAGVAEGAVAVGAADDDGVADEDGWVAAIAGAASSAKVAARARKRDIRILRFGLVVAANAAVRGQCITPFRPRYLILVNVWGLWPEEKRQDSKRQEF